MHILNVFWNSFFWMHTTLLKRILHFLLCVIDGINNVMLKQSKRFSWVCSYNSKSRRRRQKKLKHTLCDVTEAKILVLSHSFYFKFLITCLCFPHFLLKVQCPCSVPIEAASLVRLYWHSFWQSLKTKISDRSP